MNTDEYTPSLSRGAAHVFTNIASPPLDCSDARFVSIKRSSFWGFCVVNMHITAKRCIFVQLSKVAFCAQETSVGNRADGAQAALRDWLVATRDHCTALHYLEAVRLRRARSLLRRGANVSG